MLRAVNVGGTSRIKMDALQAVYESIGLKDVRTLLQSGNVVFRSSIADREQLVKRIMQEIERQLDLEVEVVLRTLAEIASIVERGPVLSPRADKASCSSCSSTAFPTRPLKLRSSSGIKRQNARDARDARPGDLSLLPRGCRSLEAVERGAREQARMSRALRATGTRSRSCSRAPARSSASLRRPSGLTPAVKACRATGPSTWNAPVRTRRWPRACRA